MSQYKHGEQCDADEFLLNLLHHITKDARWVIHYKYVYDWDSYVPVVVAHL